MRSNPSQRTRALATHALWNDGSNRAHFSKIKGPPRQIPKVLVRLGTVHKVVYESSKFAGTPDNPKGRPQLYEHETRRPRPVLATDPSGRHTYIVGGNMKVTRDGLVN